MQDVKAELALARKEGHRLCLQRTGMGQMKEWTSMGAGMQAGSVFIFVEEDPARSPTRHGIADAPKQAERVGWTGSARCY